MRLTPEQIALVQSSFTQVALASDQTARLFYDRLFELDPSARRLFTGDMTVQGQKLMQMIATAVAGLQRLESITPSLQDLGRRHVEYGVRKEQYESVGAALLHALAVTLGIGFTPEVKAAWAAAYDILATIATEAAYD